MPPALAPSVVLCTANDVVDYLSEQAIAFSLDDQDKDDGTITSSDARLTRLTYIASSRVLDYLRAYVPSEVATSWTACRYATIFTAWLLCGRRGNQRFASLKVEYDETIKTLELIEEGKTGLHDVGRRHLPQFLWSNVRVDQGYELKKVRVERPISEGTTPQYAQNVDWAADFFYER